MSDLRDWLGHISKGLFMVGFDVLLFFETGILIEDGMSATGLWAFAEILLAVVTGSVAIVAALVMLYKIGEPIQ